MDRCPAAEGTVQEAVRLASAAKQGFIPVRTSLDLVPTRLGLRLAAGASGSKLVRAGITPEDVYARGRRTLERCIGWGTKRIRTQVEVDPGIGLRGFDGVQQLARDCAWAVDMELCVFPRRG